MRRTCRFIRMLLIPVALAVLSASICEKVPERLWDRGDFHPVPGNTKPFTLPSGLTQVRMVGAADPTPESDLPLELTIANSKTERTSAALPAGLIFGPDDVAYQYMALLQDFRFSVPPDTDTVVLLPTYCCNEDLDTPDETSTYTIIAREYEREMNELLNLVDDKHLSGDTAVTLAQDALYELTDGEGLTDSTRTKLRNLP